MTFLRSIDCNQRLVVFSLMDSFFYRDCSRHSAFNALDQNQSAAVSLIDSVISGTLLAYLFKGETSAMKISPFTYVLLISTMILLVSYVSRQSISAPESQVVSYSEFKELVQNAQIGEVYFEGNQVVGTIALSNTAGNATELISYFVTYLPSLNDPAFLPLLEEMNVKITSAAQTENGTSSWFFLVLPWLAIMLFYWWFWTRMSRGGGLGGQLGDKKLNEFLAGSSRQQEKDRPAVTFDDVAGQESAKLEIQELVTFLKHPEHYSSLGAESPHGVLLVGPPGTGKTLLARALAGEAGVPFFDISASEFIEVFVGVGASRVRKMFEEAKKRSPSIIFIDELDAIGRMRGAGVGGGHDEREQTLNQILSEMDGFSGHEAVIVLSATNRPDVLDPALLRPGRFDRHVTLELPDRKAREAILKVHTRKVPLAIDANLAMIAAGTPGFSGADLKNLINEAAMAAARDGAKAVSMHHLEDMKDKVMMGSVRSLAIQPDERHRLAVHEAGHAATAWYLPNTDPIYKVTIIPRGRSLGSTYMLPEEERHTLPEEYLKDRLAVILGGRIAEKTFLGSFSSGADEDIKEATKLARAMVARWGMSEEIGPIDLRQSEDHPFLGREMAMPQHFSEATAHQVDKAVQTLLNEASTLAQKCLEAHKSAIEGLITELETHELLDEQAIRRCLDKAPVQLTPIK